MKLPNITEKNTSATEKTQDQTFCLSRVIKLTYYEEDVTLRAFTFPTKFKWWKLKK